jgi:hypothetical protein
MRLPDLSGLTLEPTGAKSSFHHCDPAGAPCVTYLPDSLLLARNPDEVERLGLTEELCGVRLPPVEDADASKVGPYETLYESAWWKLVLMELGREQLEVYLTYWRTKPQGGGEWRGLYTFWKWDLVLKRLGKGAPTDAGHMQLRIQPLPKMEKSLGIKLLLATYRANLRVQAMVANEQLARMPATAPRIKPKPPKRKASSVADDGRAAYEALRMEAREAALESQRKQAEESARKQVAEKSARKAARKAAAARDVAPKAAAREADSAAELEAELEAALEAEMEAAEQEERAEEAPTLPPVPKVKLLLRRPEPAPEPEIPPTPKAPEAPMDVDKERAVRAAFDEYLSTADDPQNPPQLPELQSWTVEELASMMDPAT